MILYLQRQYQHYRIVGCVVHMELLSISSVWFGNVQDVWMLLYPSIHQSFFATDSFYSKIWSTLVVQDLGRSYNPFIFVINKLYHHSTLSAILQVIVTIVSSNWQASNNNNVYQYQYWVLLVPAPVIADCWQNPLNISTDHRSIATIVDSILISSFYENRIFVWIEWIKSK